jgi:hemolysin activation/secretion protein
MRTIGLTSLMAVLLVAAAVQAQEDTSSAVSTEVGQEMKKVEHAVREPELAPVKTDPEVSFDDVQKAVEENAPVTAAEANEPVPMEAPAEAAPEPAAVEEAAAETAEAAPAAEPEAAGEVPSGVADATEPAPETVAVPAEEPAQEAAVEPAQGAVEEAPAESAPVEMEAAETPEPVADIAAQGMPVTRLELRGDADILEKTGLRRAFEADTVGKSLTEEQVAQIGARYQEALIKKGYYIARVWAPVEHWNDGTLIYVVDAGRIGNLALFKREGEKTVPYKGRWYSEKQLKNKMANLEPGSVFDYAELYSTVYSINAHPDLLADVDLTVRKEGEGDEQRRHVDMDFEIKEERPLHAALEFANSGTDVTEEWRAGLTVQYLNVSQNDDVITLNSPASLDLSTIRSTALSYYRPHHWRKGGNMSVFGGYSQLETEDVVPGIDLEGEGWFAGVQGSYNFIDTEKHLLNASLGLAHSVIEDKLILPDGQSTENADTAVSPLALTLSWANKQPDRRGGRTSVMWISEINRGGFLGASDDEDMELQRANAKADFIVEKLQIARVAPILRDAKDPKKDWLFYGRLALQYATEPLIPAQQMGLGGLNTVRGYLENEVLADDGAVLNLELRTPIRHSSKIPRWLKKDVKDRRYLDYEGVQFILFADAGYASLKDAISGQDDSYTLASVGPGLRFSAGEHFVARADWGLPLEETEDSELLGRGHFSIQFLF